ncbi:cytochrome c [Enterovirga sp.]|uniref:c-type cytochrome n=1 Tax=Enterovirga sp. TaxID=2026350 RepID=UPI0026153DC7|nr:cytochrome c [Enterovirga sp.]MDB5590132.1 hypothetical protein [Enterovirga sp.]
MRAALGPAVLALLFLSGCDAGTSDRPDIPATRAVQRSPVTLPEGVRPEGAAARGAAWRPPGPEVTPVLRERGRELYGVFCLPCHGERGGGDGPIVRRGFPAPLPLKPGGEPARTVQVIRDGFGLMYPMADRVRPEDAWAIAHHLQTLGPPP